MANTSLASLSALLAFCSPSAAITCKHYLHPHNHYHDHDHKFQLLDRHIMKKNSSLVQMQCLLGVLLNFPCRSFLFPIPAVQLRAARSANHFSGFSFISCPSTPGATPKVVVLEAKHSVVALVKDMFQKPGFW